MHEWDFSRPRADVFVTFLILFKIVCRTLHRKNMFHGIGSSTLNSSWILFSHCFCSPYASSEWYNSKRFDYLGTFRLFFNSRFFDFQIRSFNDFWVRLCFSGATASSRSVEMKQSDTDNLWLRIYSVPRLKSQIFFSIVSEPTCSDFRWITTAVQNRNTQRWFLTTEFLVFGAKQRCLLWINTDFYTCRWDYQNVITNSESMETNEVVIKMIFLIFIKKIPKFSTKWQRKLIFLKYFIKFNQ